MRYANVYERIQQYGHDEDFIPRPCNEPTDAYPGSQEKIEILRLRVIAGVELWHEDDRQTYDGASGGYRSGREPQQPLATGIRYYDHRMILFGTTKGRPS